MKTIYRIAKTELLTLFYSPVAWFVLLAFAFQAGMDFSDTFARCLKSQDLGNGLRSVTTSLLAGHSLFKGLLDNLYLYIPLLTMGLMSREIGSGSIKLLFSSPITNVKIILGKYLAMALYCLLLIVLLIPIISFAGFTVKDIEFPLIFSALLGMYLLICSYAAIGLFMSCLTSYQVVAATGTLAVLAILNFIGDVGQGIAFVREITYWLSMSGRAEGLLSGLICSEDVLYFFIVIMLFVTLSVLKLNSATKKPSFLLALAKYSAVILCVVMLGYVSSRPTMMSYYDTTITKRNTLTPNSQDVMNKLDGDMTITTYCNILDNDFYSGSPKHVKYDMERFKQYLRFKPEIKMNYVYYYDKVNNPSLYKRYPGMTEKEIVKKMCKVYHYDFNMFLSPEEIKKVIDLSSEGNRFVREVKRENGQKIFLRLFNDSRKHPSEAEVTAALKRFIVKAPRVGFLVGHGERSIERTRDKDYSMFVNNAHFRSSLMNQGFDGVKLSLNQEIPADIDIVVISDIRKAFTKDELEKLDKYIARGGNLIVSSDVGRQSIVNPLLNKFGISMEPGVLVQPQKDMKPNLIAANVTKETKNISKRIYNIYRYGYKVAMQGAVAVSYTHLTLPTKRIVEN